MQIEKFIKNEAELLVPQVPGGLYYRDLAREKARLRNTTDDNAPPTHGTSNLRGGRHVKRVKRARRPPSMKPRTVTALKKALNTLRETQQLEEKKAYIQVLCTWQIQ